MYRSSKITEELNINREHLLTKILHKIFLTINYIEYKLEIDRNILKTSSGCSAAW